MPRRGRPTRNKESTMSIHTTPKPADRPLGRPAAPPLRLAAGLTVALLLLGGTLVSTPAEAAPKLCGERGQILEGLAQKYEETPQALGLSGDGGVIEVLVSPEGGWTMLITYPRRPTCVVATGEAWQMLLAGQSA
jgi:hypothetical protein